MIGRATSTLNHSPNYWGFLLVFLVFAFPCIGVHALAENGYTVNFEGDFNGFRMEEFRNLSDTVKFSGEPVASMNLLRRRAERDVERFADLLRSRGYFGGEVALDLRGESGVPEVLFKVAAGPLYKVSRLELLEVDEGNGSKKAFPPEALSNLALRSGASVVSRDILDAERQFLGHFLEEGHPFAEILPREVVVDHAEHSAAVTLLVMPGPRTPIGETVIEGLTDVSGDVVLKSLPWKPGDLCRHSLLEKARRRLQDTGLFTMINIVPEETPEAPGFAMMRVSLTERKHRSIGLGADYRSEDGPGVRAMWEHRNLFGMGHRLRTQLEVSDLEPNLSVQYDNPFFLRDDQTLSLKFKAAILDPDPYESRSLDLSGMVERRLSEALSVGGGLTLRLSHVEQRREKETFFLVSSPWVLSWDRRDDRLDPSEGFLLTTRQEPHLDVTSPDVFFWKSEAGASWYKALDRDKSWVFAARLHLGAIAGEGLHAIPADARFYAGGGGSVRGYGYQRIGPEECGNIIGGRSKADWSLEMRKRLTKTLGLAAFLDGGAAFTSPFPDFSEDPRWGAGLGVRYFTPIGPVRLDAAMPLNPRHGKDDSMQFYISIGQAF